MKSLHNLKIGILLFWALWFSFATTTNFIDLLNQFSLLSGNWKFISHNYSLVKGIMSIYVTPDYAITLSFILILIAEFTISCTFWLALFRFNASKPNTLPYLNTAFTLSIFLWVAFLVGEEIFIAYAFEGTHLNLLVAELISLMAIRLLPE